MIAIRLIIAILVSTLIVIGWPMFLLCNFFDNGVAMAFGMALWSLVLWRIIVCGSGGLIGPCDTGGY